MFRKKKDRKGGDDDLPDAPNMSDDDDAMWFKPKSSATGTPDMALPGMGIPPPAPPSGIRMSISPNIPSARTSPSTSSSRKRFSVNDLVAAINYNDWAAVLKILDQDPKVASKNAQVSLKGQTTESNPLHLVVIKDPPLEVVEKMIKAFPAGASNTDRQGDRTALHWACIANASPAVLEAVTHANTASCRHQDRKFGRTPLHYLAIIAEDADQVHVLMEVERRAAMMKDSAQKTPIELANDSTNPSKVEIVAALQRKRSSVSVFGALKSRTKLRGSSPGKYKMRSSSPGKYSGSTDEAPASPGKFKMRSSSLGKYSSSTTEVPKSPGKHSSRGSTRAKSPGKYSEGASRGRRSTDGEKEGSSRGRRSTDAGEKEGSLRGRRTTGRSSKNDSRRDSKKYRESRSDGGVSNDTKMATQSLVVSDSSEEFMAPRSTAGFNPSRSVSPATTNSPSRSRSPMPMPNVSPPIVHGSPVQMVEPSAPVTTSSMVDHTGTVAPAPPTTSASMVERTSTASSQGRPSNQSLSAGMDGEIRALRDDLERKKRAVETKDNEIAQMKNQIEDNKEEVKAMHDRMQGGSSAPPTNERKLSEKREKVHRLKEKIAELQAELRRAEKDVKRLESAGSGSENMSSVYTQDQIQSKEEEQSSLQFIMEALVEEKMAAQRDVENADSELKSMETIQMLAQNDNIG
ncbi:unnamed protein product [Cylindrotheca closterium]|uniref:Uncharacterized protein n=1 Tax=Cylindrotheca closterium TaxID=2856 RepID=A0AAD2JJX9_9STRA|nr:unnamed protein product [Cylindrotheca closterium]